MTHWVKGCLFVAIVSIVVLGLAGSGLRAATEPPPEGGVLPQFELSVPEDAQARAYLGLPVSGKFAIPATPGCSSHLDGPASADWPDLAACRAPSPLLVQYELEDDLFNQAGMYAAHERLSGHYRSVGASEAYEGQFFPGPHKFDLEMQTAAFAWLKKHLSG